MEIKERNDITQPNEFINKIGEYARNDMKKSGILASLTIAQAILESSWGKYDCGGNNLFGIKGKYKGQSVMCNTSEYIKGQYVSIKDEFRKYPSWAESLADHSAFLCSVKLGNGTLRYAKVIGEKDYKKACQAIKDAGYATSPTYSQSLINLIEQYNLNRFDVEEIKPIPKPAIKKTNEQIADEIWNKNNWGTGDVRRKKLSDAGYDYEIIQGIIETKYCRKKTVTVKTPVKATAPKPVVKPISKTVQQLAKEVIHGDWGNGNIRKQRLEKAGYNYEAVQTEVNKFYK